MTRSHRWLRFAGPVLAVVLLAILTVTFHVVEQPSPKDAAFLSPTSSDGIGARRLADRLTARGITIDRETTTPDALRAAATAGSTLLVTTPGLVWPGYLSRLDGLPTTSRVVLVAPTAQTLSDLDLKVAVAGPRWTAWAPGAGCDGGWATGRATVARYRYRAVAGGLSDCYGGGAVDVDRGAAPFTLVGAADVFRNDRAGEYANATVAAALLARTPRVVWLDLHRAEPPPPQPPAPTLAPPANPNGSGRNDDNQSAGGDSGGPSTAGLFPAAFWATLAVLALAGIALAAAQGRRVGAPVAEPLPVRVPAAETVRGLGDLYRRSKADDASLATIQDAARRRLADHLGVPLEDVPRHLPGIAPDQAERLLGDPGQDLATTAEAVQNLVRHIKGTPT